MVHAYLMPDMQVTRCSPRLVWPQLCLCTQGHNCMRAMSDGGDSLCPSSLPRDLAHLVHVPASLSVADTAGEKVELSFTDQHGNTVPRDTLKQLMHTAPPLSVGRLSLMGQEQQPGAGAGTMRWLCGQQEKAVLTADAWQLHADRSVLVLTDTAILGPVPWGRKKQHRCGATSAPGWCPQCVQLISGHAAESPAA